MQALIGGRSPKQKINIGRILVRNDFYGKPALLPKDDIAEIYAVCLMLFVRIKTFERQIGENSFAILAIEKALESVKKPCVGKFLAAMPGRLSRKDLTGIPAGVHPHNGQKNMVHQFKKFFLQKTRLVGTRLIFDCIHTYIPHLHIL